MIDLKKITTYEQEKGGTCGPAALRILISYFGIKKPEKELQGLCKTDDNGTRPWFIEDALKQLGFKTVSGSKENGEKSWAALNHWVNVKRLPVIVDWLSTSGETWDGHYSVVVDINKEYITIADPQFAEPEQRIRKIKWSNFLRVWFDWESDYLEKPEDINLRWWLAAHK